MRVDMVTYIIEIAFSVLFAELIWKLIVEFFRVFKILTRDSKEKEMATYVTLDEFYSEDRKSVKQVVYKVDGDFNGDIKGDNVTVILMGNGNFNGDISSKDGEVVLIKGSINGDVKANKIVCPTEPTTEDKDQYICKSCYHYVQTPTGSYCTENSVLEKALPVGCRICKSYDRTGEATKYKSDCASFSNRSGIQQGTSPVKRIDYMYGDTCLSAYNTYPIVHMKCPHCKKRFGTQLKVQTNISDGDVLATNVEVIEHGH